MTILSCCANPPVTTSNEVEAVASNEPTPAPEPVKSPPPTEPVKAPEPKPVVVEPVVEVVKEEVKVVVEPPPPEPVKEEEPEPVKVEEPVAPAEPEPVNAEPEFPTATFEAKPFGMVLCARASGTGLVVKGLVEDGGAARLGVQKGWLCKDIGDECVTSLMFKDGLSKLQAACSSLPVTVSYIKPTVKEFSTKPIGLNLEGATSPSGEKLGAKVTKVQPGGVGESLGVEAGWDIVEVGGKCMAGEKFDVIVEALRVSTTPFTVGFHCQ